MPSARTATVPAGVGGAVAGATAPRPIRRVLLLLLAACLPSLTFAAPLFPLHLEGAADAPTAPLRAVLDSGLRILCVENPATQTVALSAFITTSARAETPSEAGIRYFVARALVDGSAVDQPELSEGLQRLGAETYVGAGVDFTEITLLAAAEDVTAAAGLLHDLLFQAKFEPATVDRLRHELATDLARIDELPESAAERVAAARLYPDHPYGWPVEGLAPTVAKLTSQEVQRVYAGTYLANNMVVVVSGGLPGATALAAVKAAFGSALPGQVFAETKERPRAAASSRDELHRPASAAVVYIGARAPGVSDPQYPAATIALSVLGSGLGSRLYQALRREASLAYTVSAAAVTARAGARAGLLVSCRAESVADVETRMLREVTRLTREPISTEEIQRAREYTCTDYALRHQRNADLAYALGAFEVAADQGAELDRDLPRLIRQVTPQEVLAAARSLFAATATVRVLPAAG